MADGYLRGLLAADPADAAAGAMLGAHLTSVGWKIRGQYRAKYVGRDQFVDFRTWLCRAEVVLIDAAARTPDDPAVWVQRLVTARGLEVGRSEVRRRYDRLAAIDPHHLLGQMHLLQSLCPKWGGTFELAHAFAGESMRGAPPGSPQGGLVAMAHIEQGTDGEDLAAARRHLSRAEVRAEVTAAAERSVWHPDFAHRYGWVWAASAFAMAFSLGGDDRAAARMFAMLGHLGSETPWQYLGSPAAEIRRWRNKVKAGAR
jgi:hypothetical protein